MTIERRNYRLELVKHALPDAVVDELLSDLVDDIVDDMDIDGGDVGRHSRRSIALSNGARIPGRNE